MADSMPSVEDIKSTINTIVDKAEAEGKLAPLASLISEMKLKTTPKELFVAAQTRDDLRGKTPEELASMLREKPTVINIILSTTPPGEEEPEGEGPEETAAEGGVEEPTGEEAVKAKMKKMKKSAMSSDQEEEDMADEEAAKAYKSKLMM